MALLFSNTLSEAIDWLAEKTGEAWSIRRLLEFILAHELPLDVVPPRDAQFGVYCRDTSRQNEAIYLWVRFHASALPTKYRASGCAINA